MGRLVCDKCGYDAVYPSRLRWFDLPFSLLLRPYRCNKCYRRSYRLRWRGR